MYPVTIEHRPIEESDDGRKGGKGGGRGRRGKEEPKKDDGKEASTQILRS